jgi:glutamate racemase
VSSPARDAPIGVFDSGVGGLTVARALLDQLPGEPLLYVGDTAHGPYGPLPLAEVRRHALAAMDGLVAQGVKLLVIACNSASSACLRDARERYDVPVVEVIQPAVRRAVVASRSGRVGLLATAGHGAEPGVRRRVRRRAAGGADQRGVPAVRRLSSSAGVTTGASCCSWPPTTSTRCCGRRRHLVLGCTHYPLLTGMISLLWGRRDARQQRGGDAKDVYRVLQQTGSDATRRRPPPVHRFSPRRPGAVRPARRRFLGPEIGTCPRMQGWHEAHRPRLLRHLPRARVARARATSSSTRASGCSSTSAPGALGQLQRHVGCSTSTPSTSATCTPTTASTWSPTPTPAATTRTASRRCSRSTARPAPPADLDSYEAPPTQGLEDVYDFREVPPGRARSARSR